MMCKIGCFLYFANVNVDALSFLTYPDFFFFPVSETKNK